MVYWHCLTHAFYIYRWLDTLPLYLYYELLIISTNKMLYQTMIHGKQVDKYVAIMHSCWLYVLISTINVYYTVCKL